VNRPRRGPVWWPVAAAAILQWVVLARAPFLPFVDLPQHVAQAQLWLHLRDASIGRLFESQLIPQVNCLALLVLAPLHALLGEALAVRALLALYVGGLGWSLYRLTRVLGTPVWGAVAALLFALQFNLWYGFLSYCLALPLFVLLVSRWAGTLTPLASGSDQSNGFVAASNPSRSFRTSGGTARTLVLDAFLWWAILLGHTLVFAFALVAFALWMAFGAGWAMRVRRALALLPALAWFGWWNGANRALLARHFPDAGGPMDAIWEGPGTKLQDIGRSLLVASSTGHTETVILLVVLAVTMWLLWRDAHLPGSERSASADLSASSERSTSSMTPARPSAPRDWVRWVGLLGLIAYAVLPYSIYERDRVTYGLFILYQRFAVFAPLVVLPSLSAPPGRTTRRILVAAVAACHLVLVLHWSAVLAQVGKEAAPINDAIAALAPGRVLKSLIYKPYPVGLRFESFLHVASYYQARNLGETDQSFAALLPSPIHYRDLRHPYLSLQDEHLRPEDFDLERSGPLYNFALTYGVPDPLPGATTLFVRNGWRVETLSSKVDGR